jgi:hypothetical protein
MKPGSANSNSYAAKMDLRFNETKITFRGSNGSVCRDKFFLGHTAM